MKEREGNRRCSVWLLSISLLMLIEGLSVVPILPRNPLPIPSLATVAKLFIVDKTIQDDTITSHEYG